MAKGRMAEKAAKRRAELDAANDLGTYQRKVAQLTAETRELKERLAKQEREAAQRERRLRAERDEGVAPQVEAVSLQLRSALASRDEAQRETKRIREKDKQLMADIARHFMDDHGMSFYDAYDAMTRIAARAIGTDWPEDMPFPGSEAEDRAFDVSPELLALKRRIQPYEDAGAASRAALRARGKR